MKDGDLAGIVTRRDLRFETDTSQSISAIMTPREQLVTVKEGASSDEVQRLLHQHRIEKILVVDDAGALAGLITVKDFDKAESFPDACKVGRFAHWAPFLESSHGFPSSGSSAIPTSASIVMPV